MGVISRSFFMNAGIIENNRLSKTCKESSKKGRSSENHFDCQMTRQDAFFLLFFGLGKKPIIERPANSLVHIMIVQKKKSVVFLLRLVLFRKKFSTHRKSSISCSPSLRKL